MIIAQVEGLHLRNKRKGETKRGGRDSGPRRTGFANVKHRPITRSLVGEATLMPTRRGPVFWRLLAKVLSALAVPAIFSEVSVHLRRARGVSADWARALARRLRTRACRRGRPARTSC